MPFRSEAQRRLFAEKVKRGEISQATFDEWQAATGNTPLPMHVAKPADQIKTATPLHSFMTRNRKPSASRKRRR